MWSTGDVVSIMAAVAGVAVVIGALKSSTASIRSELKYLTTGNTDKGRRLEELSKNLAVLEERMTGLQEEMRKRRAMAQYLFPGSDKKRRRSVAVPVTVEGDESNGDEGSDDE